MPRWLARSRSRIFGFSMRAARICSGVGFMSAIMEIVLLVQDQLALARDLQPIDRAGMVDCDLVGAAEEILADDGAHRGSQALGRPHMALLGEMGIGIVHGEV